MITVPRSLGWLKRGFGQHILLDQSLMERMVDYAGISGLDTVLEIGTGIGNLTEVISRKAGKVISIENDDRLIRVAKENLKKAKNVVLVRGDALRVKLPEFDKVVSNLPYNISSPITFRLLEHSFKVGVLMYQKEFAERMVASPGTEEYGRLTVTVCYRAEARILEEVPPEVFFPRPKVASVVAMLKPRKPPFKVLEEQMLFSVIQALFQHRRQTVRNSLLHSFGLIFPERSLPKVERRKLIDEMLPEDLKKKQVYRLAPEDFGRIADILSTFKKP